MKKLAFALGLLVVGLSAATPASADFAVVQWKSGYCRVFGDSQFGPQDGKYHWYRHRHHVHYRFATWAAAEKAMHGSVAHHRCQHWW